MPLDTFLRQHGGGLAPFVQLCDKTDLGCRWALTRVCGLQTRTSNVCFGGQAQKGQAFAEELLLHEISGRAS